jgi:hypothetical protein
MAKAEDLPGVHPSLPQHPAQKQEKKCWNKCQESEVAHEQA